MDHFDSLKREATKLERSLEDKVARYQQASCVVIRFGRYGVDEGKSRRSKRAII